MVDRAIANGSAIRCQCGNFMNGTSAKNEGTRGNPDAWIFTCPQCGYKIRMYVGSASLTTT